MTLYANFRERPWMLAIGLPVAGCDLVLGIDDHPVVPPDAGHTVITVTMESGPPRACTTGARQCVADNVETCQPSGHWGPAVACFGTRRRCADGTCVSNPGANCTVGAGVTSCGPQHDESCCSSSPVTGGSYARTYAYQAGKPTGETDQATVSDFILDDYLVTVGRFRQFVAAWNNGYMPDVGSGKHADLNDGNGLVTSAQDAGPGFEPGWIPPPPEDVLSPNSLVCNADHSTWTPSPGKNENLPINCVDWWEAYAFCIWDGGFLPSEAEWEYAAAGGHEQRQYPWGETAPGTKSLYAIYGCNYPSGTGICGPGGIAPVGIATLGKGRWGQLDLAGELGEWTLDWYADAYTPCADCANTAPGKSRVIRGGAFALGPSVMLPVTRNEADPSSRVDFLGIRCARSP